MYFWPNSDGKNPLECSGTTWHFSSFTLSHVKEPCLLTDWRPVLCTTGWGVSETGRRQWHHLPGEAGDHRRRTRALCHVSLLPAKRRSEAPRSIISAGSADGFVSSQFDDGSFVLPCSHKLADAKTRKLMSRDEFRLIHYAGEVNYNVNGVCVCVYLFFLFLCGVTSDPLLWGHFLLRGRLPLRLCYYLFGWRGRLRFGLWSGFSAVKVWFIVCTNGRRRCISSSALWTQPGLK